MPRLNSSALTLPVLYRSTACQHRCACSFVRGRFDELDVLDLAQAFD